MKIASEETTVYSKYEKIEELFDTMEDVKMERTSGMAIYQSKQSLCITSSNDVLSGLSRSFVALS